ncbi:tyrosine-type recombinase/integrase [Embleya sp. AB8]|uniref:tyrosine-type recombinase/integrase n=1 Tax=Embleya sp. AB8 TaxID=3156304 RepID=UPI003C76EB3A
MDTVVGEYLAGLGLARNTVLAYRGDLARYLSYLAGLGVRDLGAVRGVDVGGFVRDLRDQGLAEASVARCLVAVRGLHRFAVRRGLVAVDVTRGVAVPSVPVRRAPVLSVQRVEALFAAASAGAAPFGVRDRALVELLYAGGARVSEAVGADLAGVDLAVGTIRLGGGRVVPLAQSALVALDAYLIRARPGLVASGGDGAAVFLNARGGRLSRQSGWAVLAGAAARMAPADRISPRMLRSSFAAHLLDGGADVRVVQELLGHSSVSTTRVHVRETSDRARQVYSGSHPRALD